jgi:hypothetical protein
MDGIGRLALQCDKLALLRWFISLLKSLSKGDPVAVSVRAQCLAALEDEASEASALLSRLREGTSRQDIVVSAIGQAQQAIALSIERPIR